MDPMGCPVMMLISNTLQLYPSAIEKRIMARYLCGFNAKPFFLKQDPVHMRRFTYQLLQGFDFVHLSRHHGVQLQVSTCYSRDAMASCGQMQCMSLQSPDHAAAMHASHPKHSACERSCQPAFDDLVVVIPAARSEFTEPV